MDALGVVAEEGGELGVQQGDVLHEPAGDEVLHRDDDSSPSSPSR